MMARRAHGHPQTNKHVSAVGACRATMGRKGKKVVTRDNRDPRRDHHIVVVCVCLLFFFFLLLRVCGPLSSFFLSLGKRK